MQVVSSLSSSIVDTYSRCNPGYAYDPRASRPIKILTKPSEPAIPGGHDNVNDDLIVAVNDIFISPLGLQYVDLSHCLLRCRFRSETTLLILCRYIVQEMLGQGTFGQVFKCSRSENQHHKVAIKVIKNQAAYYHQARVEIGILQFLNTRADPHDKSNIVRLTDFFLHKNHLCLVFELLNLNLFELIKYNKFRGLSLALVRVFLQHILEALAVLRSSSIIHCDIKPENILLAKIESGHVKLIDFGSACFSNRAVYSYIQSRFYRSPEVVLGHPYTMAVDMWSLGCVAAELFLGLPLFPAACEHDLLGRIQDTIGPMSPYLLSQGKNAYKFYSKTFVDSDGRQKYTLCSAEEFTAITGQPAPKGKQYFRHTRLADIINAYPLRPGMTDEEIYRERQNRESFTDFLLGLLEVDPSARWTPRQAQQHPFISGAAFRGPFQPAGDLNAAISHPGAGQPSSSSSSSSTTAARTIGQGSRHDFNQGSLRHEESSQQSTANRSLNMPGMPMSIPKPRKGLTSAATASTEGGGAAARASSPLSNTPTVSRASAPQISSSSNNNGNSGAYTWNNALSTAAMLATSPHVHAQAHAAAMAAVQSPLRLQQQQLAASSYVPAGSLQRIIEQHMTLMQGSTSSFSSAATQRYKYSSTPTTAAPSTSWQSTPPSSSLPPFTPPSRSFGIHPEKQHMLASYVPPSPSFGANSDGRLLPLLQLPMQDSPLAGPGASGMRALRQHQSGSTAGAEDFFSSSSCGGASFQPYSLRTFHSVLAEAANSQQQQQQQQHYYHPPTTTNPAAAAISSSQEHIKGISASAALYPTTGGVGDHQQGPFARAAPVMSPMHLPTKENSETSIENGCGSVSGTPQKERLSSSSIPPEDDPNPADWDPLWSDDLLKEDDGEGDAAPAGGVSHQPSRHDNAEHTHTNAHTMLDYTRDESGNDKKHCSSGNVVVMQHGRDGQIEDLVLAMQHLPQLSDIKRSIDAQQCDHHSE